MSTDDFRATIVRLQRLAADVQARSAAPGGTLYPAEHPVAKLLEAVNTLRPAEPAAAPSGKACDACGGTRRVSNAGRGEVACPRCGGTGTGRADGR